MTKDKINVKINKDPFHGFNSEEIKMESEVKENVASTSHESSDGIVISEGSDESDCMTQTTPQIMNVQDTN